MVQIVSGKLRCTSVPSVASTVVDAAKAAASSMQDAARRLPISKRAAFDSAAQSMSTFVSTASSLAHHHDNAARRLVQSSKAVRAANSAACKAQHGAYASDGPW